MHTIHKSSSKISSSVKSNSTEFELEYGFTLLVIRSLGFGIFMLSDHLKMERTVANKDRGKE